MSATGTWTSNPSRAVSGFTLIEILVVLVIIGVLIAGATLAVGVVGKDSDLEKERDRITALLDYLREQAALQNREYGMRCYTGGYEFLVFDARTGQWQRLQGDPLTRPRRLAAGLELELSIEGREVVLPRPRIDEDRNSEELAPQILLFSGGDLNLFELTLRREASGEGALFAPAENSDRIQVTPLPGAAT